MDRFLLQEYAEAQEKLSTGIPRFIALRFIVLHGCCIFFYKSKARPSTSKRTVTRFTLILGWSGTGLQHLWGMPVIYQRLHKRGEGNIEWFMPHTIACFFYCIYFYKVITNSARLLTIRFQGRRFITYSLSGILVSHANVQKLWTNHYGYESSIKT